MAVDPTPQNAPQIAAMLEPWAVKTYGATLDYSPSSLRQIDGIIDDLRTDQKFEDIQALLFIIGCYVGEVFVRHAAGEWKLATEVGMAAVASSPIVVLLHNGRGANPVGKVYKRFRNGPEDNLAYYYHVMAEVPPEALEAKPENAQS